MCSSHSTPAALATFIKISSGRINFESGYPTHRAIAIESERTRARIGKITCHVAGSGNNSVLTPRGNPR
jgi:hypothetical protein